MDDGEEARTEGGEEPFQRSLDGSVAPYVFAGLSDADIVV